jgi:serine/threonine protein kinase
MSIPPFSSESDLQADQSPATDLVGSILPGNVRVLSRLGHTAEGVLYRAEYSTGLKVALLVLHPAKNATEADEPARFLRLQQQIQRAIQIQHPNVAAVYEIGKTGGSIYVVLEHLTGELLSDILAARGALQLDEAHALWREITAGLHAAHSAGLVHGNLSPRSILITNAGDRNPGVKLIRFPILPAVLEQQSNPPTDPRYASPERKSGHMPDESGDVYSLAAVLHHLLSGKPPDGSPVRSLPAGMRAVLTQALSSTPGQRFQSVVEFATAVERATAVATRPNASRPNRSGANRSLIAAGVTLVVIMAGLWLVWSLRRGGVGPPQETATRAAVGVQPGENPETLPPSRKSGRTSQVQRDSASARSSGRLAKGRPPPMPPGARVGPAPVSPKKDEVLRSSVRRDSTPQPKLSAFRRLHPWAAIPGKRFYFLSSCPVALDATDLLYFRTEEEARANGFVRIGVPGCY